MNIVSGITTNDGIVSATFTDGHHMEFKLDTQRWLGPPVSRLEGFKLFRGDVLVCEFHGCVHRCGSSDDFSSAHIASIADGYTPQSVAAYWRAAHSRASNDFHAKKENIFEYPWSVIDAGLGKLMMLEAGVTTGEEW